MRVHGPLCASGLLLTLSACGPDGGITLDDAVARVSAEQLAEHVSVLAHDSMRGRDTDDVGYEQARDYVVQEFRRIGLEPIDGDSYLQPFGLLEVVGDSGSRLTVGGTVLDFPDVVATPDWLGQMPVRAAEGLFLGRDLLGSEGAAGEVDAEGKIVFVLAGAPPGLADDPDVAMRERAHVELAYRAGAAAVVVLNPDGNDAVWKARASGGSPNRAVADGSTPAPRPAARVGPAASRRLLDRWQAGSVGAVRIEPRHEIRSLQSWNVGGFWSGSDPERGGETIVFTAHLDHVGIGRPDLNGDSIYNGTHDNALGIAKVLAVAEALAGADLPRSVLFLAMGAEESGLLGSWHYVNHPIVPLERTVASINHDGGLVDGARTDDVFAWGPEFSTVEGDLAWAARETGMQVSHEKRAPFAPSAGLLYRSDHYPFLISGVPVVYLMPGFTIDGDPELGRKAWEDYLGTVHHRQADNLMAGASYASPVAMTALSIRLAWRLAQAEGMPQTHDDAPIARRRGPPTGLFFEGSR